MEMQLLLDAEARKTNELKYLVRKARDENEWLSSAYN
jgi:hypothetical protein